MGHALISVADWIKRAARTTGAWWERFWFTPVEPALLGLMRLATGAMLLYTHAVWGLRLKSFFGPTSWLSPDLVRAIQADSYSYSFWWLVPENGIWIAHSIALSIFFLFMIGFATRVTSVLALAAAISYANRVPAALFGLDQINIMLTLYLAIGPSGATFSVDRWIKTRRGRPAPSPSISANLALRLVQFHMCVIYFFAGISKLQGPSWWSGEAMWLAFANREYQTLDMTWLAWHPWLVNLMTLITLCWEISFCVLIWKPLFRPIMLIGAVALHAGIGVCLGMWTFALIMLVGCASFLPAGVIHAWVLHLRDRRLARKATLLTGEAIGKLARETAGHPRPHASAGHVGHHHSSTG